MTILSKIALNVASLLGRRPPAPAIPFDAQVLTILEMAAEDARVHGGRPIEPDHILLALMATGEDGAAQLLKRLRVDTTVVTQRLRASQPDGPAGPEQIVQLYTDRGRRVLEGTLFEAAETNAESADSLHLLAGVLREVRSHAARILADSGVTLDVVRAARGRTQT